MRISRAEKSSKIGTLISDDSRLGEIHESREKALSAALAAPYAEERNFQPKCKLRGLQ